MAGEEKKPEHNPFEIVFVLIGLFALGAAFIFLRGGFNGLQNAGSTIITPTTAPIISHPSPQP